MTDPTPEAQVPSELVLKFDPLTIEHLGSNMYSRLPKRRRGARGECL